MSEEGRIVSPRFFHIVLNDEGWKVLQMYRAGKSLRQIGAVFGVSYGTIRRVLVAHGEEIVMRKPGRPKKKREAVMEH